MYSHCTTGGWILGNRIDGTQAEYVRIPHADTSLYKIPAGVEEEALVMLSDIFPTSFECGVLNGKVQPGATVAIVGAGPIGLMFMHLAELSGLNVIAVVKRDEQVAAAKRFGASDVIQITPDVDPVAAVRALTPQRRGVDIAIEAVAKPIAWQWAVDMVRKGGTVNFFGGCAVGTRVSFDTNRLHYNDITLKSSFHHTPAACRRAFDLVASGRFKCSEYITGRARLTELNGVFRKLMDRSNDIKTAIIP